MNIERSSHKISSNILRLLQDSSFGRMSEFLIVDDLYKVLEQIQRIRFYSCNSCKKRIVSLMQHTKNYRAFLFDLNGTMIDDMQYHIHAWHRILNSLGAGISLEKTKEECYGKNHELLERIFPGVFSEEEKDKMSVEKEKEYQQKFK